MQALDRFGGLAITYGVYAVEVDESETSVPGPYVGFNALLLLNSTLTVEA
jgi:hypothetical protein